MDHLKQFPATAEFYEKYWNKRPFVVRGWLSAEDLKPLMGQEALLTLAQDEDVDCKWVAAPEGAQGWQVAAGPFAAPFAAGGAPFADEKSLAERVTEPGQSLLVQGVDALHLPTAELWQRLPAAPLWLRDDIMASISGPAGTVGPHVDSYHVFLLQGEGTRRWQVSEDELADTALVPDLPLKILAAEFRGPSVDCEPGDLLYIPPGFGHHGVSQSTAITYSLGFLGPDTLELWERYGAYLDALAEDDDATLRGRYRGAALTAADNGFALSATTQQTIKARMAQALDHPAFGEWLGEYFSLSPTPREATEGELEDFRQKACAQGLTTACPFKVVLSHGSAGEAMTQVAGLSTRLDDAGWRVVEQLARLRPATPAQLAACPAAEDEDLWPLLHYLWEEGYLTLA